MKPRSTIAAVTIVTVLTLLFSLFPTHLAQAQSTSLTYTPVADAYVTQASPDTNNGSAASLRVDQDPLLRSYLRFNVNSINGAAVQSAKLRIYAESANSGGFTVHQESDNNWGENTLTFNNSPAIGSKINSCGSVSTGTWKEVDVTSIVTKDSMYSFVLVPVNTTNLKMSSRESGSHAPQLVVVLNSPDATATVPALPTNTPTAIVLPTNTPVPATPTMVASPTSISTNLPLPTNTPTTPSGTDWQPSFPIRAAFYYPWFAEAWTQQGIYPYTNYTPKLGYYSATDQTILKKHIEMMQYGNIQAGIASWWGQGSQTDNKIAGLLTSATGTHFRWGLYYENESLGDPSASQIQNDLTYIRDHYGKDPSFLRVNGKFVVFVYAAANDVCGMADRWKQGNTVGAYVVLKVFPGYKTCASQPDSWHQYSPAVPTDSQGTYSYAISPGFWLKATAERLARDINRWNQNVASMVASNANWQLVTTFNEWGEGTIVEPATQWASASGYGLYLDALHNNGGGTVPPATPTSVVPNPTATRTSVVPLPTATPTVAGPNPTATSTTAPPVATPTRTSTTPPVATATRTPTTPPAATPTAIPTSSSGGNILLLAGDICKHNVGSTDYTANCKKTGDLIRSVLSANAGVQVQTLGDNVNNDGGSSAYDAQYTDLYAPNWGSFLNVTHSLVGNHDTYAPGGTTPYFNYFGAAAGPTKPGGYYSYEIGSSWHVVVLNAQCSQAGGCNAGSPQYNWLVNDLQQNTKKCILAVWHQPRFTSGRHTDDTLSAAWWDVLYTYGADIVANGHNHNYERFDLINPQQAAAADGIREFIVGTGGAPGDAYSYASHPLDPNEAVRSQTITYGVLKLTLLDGSYQWNYLPAAGYTFTDSGSTNCH